MMKMEWSVIGETSFRIIKLQKNTTNKDNDCNRCAHPALMRKLRLFLNCSEVTC